MHRITLARRATAGSMRRSTTAAKPRCADIPSFRPYGVVGDRPYMQRCLRGERMQTDQGMKITVTVALLLDNRVRCPSSADRDADDARTALKTATDNHRHFPLVQKRAQEHGIL